MIESSIIILILTELEHLTLDVSNRYEIVNSLKQAAATAMIEKASTIDNTKTTQFII